LSLTSFLKSREVRAKFGEIFAKPRVKLGSLTAPPLTKNYSLVGTAFDYLLRFQLEHWYTRSQGKYWIAEVAVKLLKLETELYEQADRIIRTARERHSHFVQTGELSDDLLVSCLELAQLDPIFRRAGYVPQIRTPHTDDVLDLRNLLALVKHNTFEPKHICLLDPTFGSASLLVGGADVDLVVDQTIIDIKTTKKPNLQRDHFNQIIGYYILYRLGNVDGLPEAHQITHIGLYFSRFGELVKFPVEEIIPGDVISSFEAWFIEQAEQRFGTDFDKLRKISIR
jgi:hypothetical protein